MSEQAVDARWPLSVYDVDPDFGRKIVLADDGGVHSPLVSLECGEHVLLFAPDQAAAMSKWLTQWLAQPEVVDILEASQ